MAIYVSVARYGNEETVIVLPGGRVRHVGACTISDLADVAERTATEFPGEALIIDPTALGSALVDALRAKGLTVKEVR